MRSSAPPNRPARDGGRRSGSRGEASIAMPPPHECPSKSQRAIPNASRMATTSPASYSMRESRTAGGSSLAPRPRWSYRMSWRLAASGASAGQSSACEYREGPGGASAHAAWARTTGSGSSRAAASSAGIVRGSRRLPRATAALRASPRRFARVIALAPNRARHSWSLEGEQLGGVGIHAIGAAAQRRLGDVAREPHVPRADVLADVAAVEELADRRAELERDLALQLDREVGDAARRVERARRGEGACVGHASRQRVQVPQRSASNGASGSRSASVNRAPMKKNEPRPGIDQVRVLAEPAEPGAAREVALEHGPGVHVRAGARRAAAWRPRTSGRVRRAFRASRRGSRRRGRSARSGPPAACLRSSSRRRSRIACRAPGAARRAAGRRPARDSASRPRSHWRARRRTRGRYRARPGQRRRRGRIRVRTPAPWPAPRSAPCPAPASHPTARCSLVAHSPRRAQRA